MRHPMATRAFLVSPANPGAVPSRVRFHQRDETIRGDSILDPPRQFLLRAGSPRRRSNVPSRLHSGEGYRHVPPNPSDGSVWRVLALKISSLPVRLPWRFPFLLWHPLRKSRPPRNHLHRTSANPPPPTHP